MFARLRIIGLCLREIAANVVLDLEKTESQWQSHGAIATAGSLAAAQVRARLR
jgi:hypothetical protein